MYIQSLKAHNTSEQHNHAKKIHSRGKITQRNWARNFEAYLIDDLVQKCIEADKFESVK